MADAAAPQSIKVRSLVSNRTADPLIEIESPALKVLLDAEGARAHAFAILSAVEASITDAFLFEFAQITLGVTHPQAVMLMRDLRAFRERLPQADHGPLEED